MFRVPRYSPSNPYDFSKPFDMHRWSDFPEVGRALDAVLCAIKPHVPRSIKPRKLRWCVMTVTLDLYVASLIHSNFYVGFSRNRNSYSARSRYNALNIGLTIVEIIDAMFAAGLVEGKRKGIYYPGYTRNPRMRATEALLSIIEAANVQPSMVSNHPNREAIELRERREGRKKQVRIEYKDTAVTAAMRASLRAYNELIARTEITIEPSVFAAYRDSERYRDRPIDFTRKFTRRIFSNGTFSEGGRYYGGWWESCPSDLRESILINGNRTQELDFGNIHIAIIYAMEGINYAWEVGGDAYTLPGYEHLADFDRRMLRECVKDVQLIAINTTPEKAVGAIWSKFFEDPLKYEWFKTSGLTVRALMEGLLAKHPRIVDYFFKGIGIKLQNWDALVAERVMQHFTEQGIPVLTIHDSFIIEKARWFELAHVMRVAMSEVIGPKLLGTTGGVGVRIKAKGGDHEELMNAMLKQGEGFGPTPADESFEWDELDYPDPDF